MRISLLNLLLGQFYEELGELTFFAVLQFKTLTIDSVGIFVSSALPIAFIAIGGIIFFFPWRTIQKFQKLKKKMLKSPKKKSALYINDFKKRSEGMLILYGDFKELSISHQSCLLILTARAIFFNFTVAVWGSFPNIQAFIIITGVSWPTKI